MQANSIHAGIDSLPARALPDNDLGSCWGQATHWKTYAETEMEAGNHSQVKAIFSRSLLNCLNLALWQTYLRFIKQVGPQKQL